MTLHPDVQTKAQEEIDKVIGLERLPTFEDRPNLPFIECIIRELYRWGPASNLGVFHKSIEDDEYEGYFIPAGPISSIDYILQLVSHSLNHRHNHHTQSLVLLCNYHRGHV
jgi:hypothetical protein